MCVVYSAVLGLTLARRLAGGAVMTDSLFIPYAGVLVAALGYEIVILFLLRRALRRNVLMCRAVARVLRLRVQRDRGGG